MKKEVTELDLRRPEFQDPKLKPEHFEFDADGEVVRKDRFETGMRKVHGVLIGLGLASARDKWTVDSVVSGIKSALASPVFQRYKHHRTSDIYELLHVANEVDSEKFPATAVYRSEKTGAVYARPYKDFLNSFGEVTA